MRAFLAIILSLTILLPLSLVGLEHVMQTAAKRVAERRMKGRGNREDLVVFDREAVVAASWEGQHEFKLGGRYYDVVRTEAEGEQQRFYCRPDNLETSIEEGILHIISSWSGSIPQKDRGLGSACLDWMKSLFFQHIPPFRSGRGVPAVVRTWARIAEHFPAKIFAEPGCQPPEARI